MTKYIVKQQKIITAEITVEANSKEEAEIKSYEGEYDEVKDVKTGHFFFPEEWETVEIREVLKDGTQRKIS